MKATLKLLLTVRINNLIICLLLGTPAGTAFNWAAGLTWFCTLGVCWWFVKFAGIQIFFVSLPGWFVAGILYILLSKFYQRKVRPD